MAHDITDMQTNKVTATTLTVCCLGWSTKPIKELFAEVSCFSQEEVEPKTQVFSAVGDMNTWGFPSERPSRPLSTVDLDSKQKEEIIADVTKYLGKCC